MRMGYRGTRHRWLTAIKDKAMDREARVSGRACASGESSARADGENQFSVSANSGASAPCLAFDRVSGAFLLFLLFL